MVAEADLNQRPSGYEVSIFCLKVLFFNGFSRFDLHVDLHVKFYNQITKSCYYSVLVLINFLANDKV